MRIPAIALCAMLASGLAGAETLYKLVAPDGKVTYSQEAPKNFDGKVIRLDIDPNANTSDGKRAAPAKSKALEANEKVIHADPTAAGRGALDAAQEKLTAARKAFENARDNPGPDDVQRVGTAKGGARPVFSESYQRRLDKLEADMKAAQEDVDKLERGR